ncbi:hypothetical protein L917_07983 [Phytophthora nicotianae]|uniref:Uncharacterized protein n=1 Tax=Phytophthora nicotianae TaxID=4792 RepID=W2L976_PHYNI|nr:hypothetical protein L917_07983 [Phytophthora nicotianae]
MAYQLKAPVDGLFTLDNQNRVKLLKALDYEARNAYDLMLLLQENQVTVPYAACQIRVNVVDVNEAPVVTNYQASRVIKENALPPVSLPAALGATDPDAYDSFTLAIASGGNGNFVINREGFIVATKSLDFETTPQFVLDVIAKDLGGLENHASVVIVVQDGPEPPVCASFPFNVAENTVVGTNIGTMNAHVSDPDAGDSITYRLLSQSVPGTLSIDSSTGALTLQKALNYEIQDTIPFGAQFTDKTGLQVTCDYTIAVTDSNDVPVLTSAVFRVPENCAGNDCLVGDLAKFAFDEDKGTVLTFTLVSGGDSLSIQGSQLWATGSLNFEKTPVLKIIVSVDDERHGHDETAMAVQVVDVNEPPTGKIFTKKILENIPIGTVVYTFEARDPEGDQLVFTIVRADTGFDSLFGVVGGNIVTKADIDYEALTAHSFQTHIRICDPLKLCTEVGPNTIEIMDGPDAPIIETAAATVSIPESASIGSAVGATFTVLDEDVGQSSQLVYAIHSGDPQNQFSISGSTGALTVSSSLNAEVVSEYKIIMQATDADGLIGYSDPIIIAVQMVPSPPYFVGTAAAKANYNVDLSQLGDGSYATVSLPIADRDPGQIGGICSITTANDKFSIKTSTDGTACELSVLQDVYIPEVADNERISVGLRVTDTVNASSFSEVTIHVLSRNINHPPKCTSAEVQVLENSPYGVIVGTITGSDPDVTDKVSFSIVSGDDSDVFHINSTSGVVTVGTKSPDYETKRRYTLKIRVRDDAATPLSGVCTLGVDIGNELESPVCSATVFTTVSENNAMNALVGDALWKICIDPDVGLGNSTAFLFEVVGDNQKFTADVATGQLKATQMLDFEQQRAYNITLIVRNAFRPAKSTLLGVNVEILDQDDPPKLSFRPTFPSSTLVGVDVPEMAVIGTSVGTLAVYDEDANDVCTVALVNSAFVVQSINSTAYNLVLAKPLDYETRSRYSLQVTATDTAKVSATLTIDVRVSDVNEAPYFPTNQHFFIAENVAMHTIATSKYRPRGPCTIVDDTARIDSQTVVAYGICLQRCAQMETCEAGVFNYSSSLCSLYKTLPTSCVPCENCESFESIGEHSINTALLISNDTVNVHQDKLVRVPDTDFTLECWVAISANEGALVTWKDNSNSFTGLQLEYVGETLRISLHGVVINTKVAFMPALWYHVALTFDSTQGELKVYLDGGVVLQQQILSRIGRKWGTSATLVVGNCGYGVNCPVKPFIFSIDELRLWNKVMTFEAIRSNFARSIDPKQTSLLAFYRLNGDLVDAMSSGSAMNTSDGKVAQFGSAPVISESTGKVAERWRLLVISDNGATSFGIAELVWFSEGTRLDMATSLLSFKTSGGSDFSKAIDSDTTTIAKIGSDFVGGTGIWIELVFKIPVSATKVVLATDNDLTHCVSVVIIQYWDAVKADWGASSYLRNINKPSSRFASYAPTQYLLADDDDTGTTNLTYTLRSDQFASLFEIDSSTGYIKINTSALDYETQNYYELQINVQDNGNLRAWTTVMIWIVDVNEAPMLIANSILQVSETAGVGTTIERINLYDPDNDDLAVSIVEGNYQDAFSIEMNSLVVAHEVLDYETYPTYSLKLLIQELRPVNPLSAYGYLAVTVRDVNEAPICSNQTRKVPENARVGTRIGDALVATDPDIGQRVSFTFVDGNGDSFFAVDSVTGQLSVAQGPAQNFTGCFSHLRNGLIGPFNTDESFIPFSDCYQRCFSFQFMALGFGYECWCSNMMPGLMENRLSQTTCDIVCNDAPGKTCGGINQYAVYQLGAPLDYEKNHRYVILLKAVDNGNPAMATVFNVTIDVTDVNEAPTIATSDIYVDEGKATTVDLFKVLFIGDEDSSDTSRVSLVWCSERTCPFEYDGAKNQLIVNIALDYEQKHSYVLTFRVTDNGSLTADSNLTVFVRDVNEPPIIFYSDFELRENMPNGSLIGLPVAAYDPDQGGGVEFSIASQSGDGCLQIGAHSGQLSVAKTTCFDYESLLFDSVESSASLIHNTDQVTITGVRFIGETKSQSLVEILYTRSAQGPVAFWTSLREVLVVRVDTSGDLFYATNITAEPVANSNTVTGTITFELPRLRIGHVLDGKLRDTEWYRLFDVAKLKKTFQVIISVHDSSPDALSSTKMFDIKLLNQVEPPVLLPNITVQVVENTPIGTRIEPAMTSLFDDPEGSTALQFSLASQSILGSFYLDASTGYLHVGSRGINYEELSTHSLNVTVRNGDITASYILAITVLDANDPPRITCPHVHINENAPINTLVSEPVIVTDEDSYDRYFTYRVQNESETFSVDSGGRLILKQLVDYESRRFYHVAVEVIDHGGLSGNCVVIVEIIDVNEPPSGAMYYNGSVYQTAPVGHRILKFDLQDPEGKTLKFSITTSSVDQDKFAISDDQVLFVNKATSISSASAAVVSIEVNDGYNRVQILCSLSVLADPPPIQCLGKEQSLSVSENAVGATVGRVRFLPSSYSAKAYTLQDSLVPFTLNSTTGDVVVNDLLPLDYERQSIYSLTIAVYYSSVNYIICPIIIRVLDVDEPPICTGQSASVRENLVGYDKWILQTDATDPEVGHLTFTISENRLFYSNTSGAVFAKDLSLINYEEQPYYALVMSISDGVNTVQCPVIIYVIDTNDCPQISKQVRHIHENSAAGTFVGDAITVRDEDYSLHSSGRITFTVNSDIFTIETSGILMISNSSKLDYEIQQQVDLVVFATDDAVESCTSNATVTIFVVNVNEPPLIVPSQVGSVLEFTKALSQDSSVAVLNVTAHDPDKDDKLGFSLLSSNISYLFRIEYVTGKIFVTDTSAFDFEKRSMYHLDVTVTDLGGLTSTQQVEIRVVDTNEPPVFKLSSGSINENSPVNTAVLNPLDIIAMDPEGDNVTYSINGTATALPFEFKDNQLVVSRAQLDYEVVAQYTTTIHACDSRGLCSFSTFQITVNDVNEPPVILPAQISIEENAGEGALVGSPLLASDADRGQRLMYSIVDEDAYDLFGIQSCNGQVYVKRSNSLDFERSASYKIVVAVRDSGLPSLTSSATITIAIRDVNEAPIFTADYSIRFETKNVIADPTSSLTGVDLVTAIRSASQPSGFCSGTIDSAARFSKNAVCRDGSQGEYGAMIEWKILLKTNSDMAFRILADVAINAVFFIDQALYSSEPLFRPGFDLQYGEEVTVGQVHRGVHRVIVFLYSPSDSPVSLETMINSAGWQAVSVPTFDAIVSKAVERSIPENSAPGTVVGAPLQAIDQDKNSKLYYSIGQQNQPGLFIVEKETGQLVLGQNNSLDFEAESSYRLLIQVTDSELTSQEWILVKVTDVNEPPVLLSPQIFSVKENAKAYTQIGSPLSPMDPDGVLGNYTFAIIPARELIPFELSSTSGQLFVAANSGIDYEARVDYTFQVKATDIDGLTVTSDVAINVIDVNEPPVMYVTALPIMENTPQGTVVAQVQGFDPENQTLSFSYASTFAGDGNSTAFRVVQTSSSTAQIEVRGARIDFEQQRSFEMSVTATDTGENSLSVSQTFTVIVIDVNEPPQLTVSLPIYMSIPEQTANGSLVGTTISSYFSDPDTSDSITIKLVSSVPVNGAFNVSSTGQLSVQNSGLLDFEALTMIQLSCQAADKGRNIVDVLVNIAITNVNEAPYFTESVVQINIPESSTIGSEMHRVAALDPDGNGADLRYYIVSGNSNQAFVLTNLGVLKTSRILSALEVFNISVDAIDTLGNGLQSQTNQVLMISVSSVNSPPVVDNFVFHLDENTGIGTRIGQNALTITEIAQLDDGIGGVLHYMTPGGKFFGNNSHDLLLDGTYDFVFGDLDFSVAMSEATEN